jgi:uncharacterized RDD family membrane protein YckC
LEPPIESVEAHNAPHSSPSADPHYGGFWTRLGALLLDGLVLAPIVLLQIWSFGRQRSVYYLTHLASYVFVLVNTVLLVRWRGGSTGKLLWGLRVVRADLKPVGWKEAWLREAVMLATGIISTAAYLSAVGQMSDDEFLGRGSGDRFKRIDELGGLALRMANWLSYLWMGSELIVLLTNRRRRALHDFIGGTVVIHEGKQRGCLLGAIVLMGFVTFVYLIVKLSKP